ncbi:FAD-binding oxidoreductase [Caenispirillum salinarum]|uniref:FAD-binding oxidoreductase n=1 Tax=Caenispirillum salinarum TaxID=859058 RepID=UPI00384F0A22
MSELLEQAVTAELLDRITEVVGTKGILTAENDMAPFMAEERGLFVGKALAVVKPGSTEEVAEVVRLCADAGVGIVPQGGNTGLVGGNVPFEHGREIVLNTSRLNRIRDIDPVNFTITVDAGVVLETIQQAADEADCLFPLALGAQGSCQIGGNIASNAGGVNVLKYGNTRELVLGLEVVLPDGSIWNNMKSLGKDNTGYALKHLFIGGEGTLGIITGAVLKLFPKPVEQQTALCALDDVADVTKVLSRARALSGDAVTAFELIGRFGMELADRHLDGVSDPFEAPHPWYVLVEFSSSRPDANLRGAFETFLESAFEEGIIADAVIAESLDQGKMFWRLREGLPEAQKHEGASIKHDVSVPVSRVPEFLDRATKAVTEAMPGIRPCPFGHVGDGNIHYNLTQPEGMDPKEYLGHWDAMNRIVHDIVVDMTGSISAEHGVGRLKVDEIVHYKQAEEIEMMRRIKKALDPKGIMNPGKVVRV